MARAALRPPASSAGARGPRVTGQHLPGRGAAALIRLWWIRAPLSPSASPCTRSTAKPGSTTQIPARTPGTGGGGAAGTTAASGTPGNVTWTLGSIAWTPGSITAGRTAIAVNSVATTTARPGPGRLIPGSARSSRSRGPPGRWR